jgi:uncharacterized membrane protein
MTWLQRYHIRHYLQHSIVVLPVVGIAVALVTALLVNSLDRRMGWMSSQSPDSARMVIGALSGATFTFIVFLSSTLLLAVQLASGQLTPRIIAFVFKDPVTKASLTVFSFTFALSLAVLVQIDDRVPFLSQKLGVWSCVASLCAFFYLIDHVGKELRPSGVLKDLGQTGREVIESVYPSLLASSPETSREIVEALDDEPIIEVPSPKGGVVLAFDVKGLAATARRADCLIEMVPQVGDFIGAGDPLFRVYKSSAVSPKLDGSRLCTFVAVGQERTAEQDPALAFRIVVDIASKALSPAINDPTTAVLAIDQIHHLLRQVARRHLDEGLIQDAEGRPRLVYRTPDWEDFVKLATTEIRQFGATSIQIPRRLRAMLESLIETLPEERTIALRHELELLRRTAEQSFSEPEDRALAAAGDSQGLGGACELIRDHQQSQTGVLE